MFSKFSNVLSKIAYGRGTWDKLNWVPQGGWRLRGQHRKGSPCPGKPEKEWPLQVTLQWVSRPVCFQHHQVSSHLHQSCVV